MLLDGLMTRQADVYHVRSPYVYTSVMDVMAGFAGRAVSEKWRAEPRPEPDSGKPTVRDRRGACRNVNQGGTRHPLYNRKGTGRKLSTYRCARYISIPTTARCV